MADAIFTVSESTILCYDIQYNVSCLRLSLLRADSVDNVHAATHEFDILFHREQCGDSTDGNWHFFSVCCLSAFLIADDRLHINSEYTFSNVLMCFNIHATASNYSFTLQIVYHKINIKELLLKRRSTIIAFRRILVAIIKMINSHRHSTSNIHLHLPDVVM